MKNTNNIKMIHTTKIMDDNLYFILYTFSMDVYCKPIFRYIMKEYSIASDIPGYFSKPENSYILSL